jgi:hypothetical protein
MAKTLAEEIAGLRKDFVAGLGQVASLLSAQIKQRRTQAEMQAKRGGGLAALGGLASLSNFLPGEFQSLFSTSRNIFRTATQVVGSVARAAGDTATAKAAAGGAGALANPAVAVALLVAAVVAAGAAFAALPSLTQHFGQSLLDAQRHLGKFSVAMANVLLLTEQRDIRRDIDVGQRTAGSAGVLAQTLGDLKDTNSQSLVLWQNIKNLFGASLIAIVNEIAKILNELLLVGKSFLPEKIQKLLDILEGKNNQLPLGDMLTKAVQAEVTKRARNDERFANPFGP